MMYYIDIVHLGHGGPRPKSDIGGRGVSNRIFLLSVATYPKILYKIFYILTIGPMTGYAPRRTGIARVPLGSAGIMGLVFILAGNMQGTAGLAQVLWDLVWFCKGYRGIFGEHRGTSGIVGDCRDCRDCRDCQGLSGIVRDCRDCGDCRDCQGLSGIVGDCGDYQGLSEIVGDCLGLSGIVRDCQGLSGIIRNCTVLVRTWMVFFGITGLIWVWHGIAGIA
jgi:hypothetical protein